jgi:hypothetical protein
MMKMTTDLNVGKQRAGVVHAIVLLDRLLPAERGVKMRMQIEEGLAL